VELKPGFYLPGMFLQCIGWKDQCSLNW